MDNLDTYHAALDLSGAEASLAVMKNGSKEPMLVAHQEMRGRGAALLLEWIQARLTEKQLTTAQISRWTVGSGPGSFTGLRMAAALVSGLIFGKANIVARTMPTAIGLAAGIDTAPGESIAVLFDGRNHELLMFGADKSETGLTANGETLVLNAESATDLDTKYNRMVAFTHDRDPILKVLPTALHARISFIDHLPIDKMLTIESDNWNNDLTDLVYVRQAVFTQPAF